MCECGFYSFKLGSYRSVQKLRVNWIKAEMSRKPYLADGLKACILPGEEGLDYVRLSREKENLLPGTVAFIFHSDSDGFWTTRETRSILKAILELKPFFQKTMDQRWFYEEDGCFVLEDLFQHCVSKGETVDLF